MRGRARPTEPVLATFEGRLSAEQNVVADERLLRAGVAAVRVSVLSDRSVSVGVGVPTTSPALERARADGRTVVRRRSGGTAVLHAPGDVAWSLVLPRDDPRVGRAFARSYGRLGEGVVRFLHACGVTARWSAPLAVVPEYCLLGPRGEVLTVSGRVLGGAAQHLAGRALLHHGILPRTVDRAALGQLFGLSVPGTADLLTSLEELGVEGPEESLGRSLARTLAEALDAQSGTG